MAVVTIDELKNYLRIDTNDDNELLDMIVASAERTCMDIARVDNIDDFAKIENSTLAEMYACAYLYEHREEADHEALNLTLRALLFGGREVKF